ncbi:MAG: hypothetical protein EBR30_12730 [Cytophagia bacterium]|nr:hypothetical protein [Cytophagia bacterium]NBW35861.1 hypothetical protein [Cytophagia bacterium]
MISSMKGNSSKEVGNVNVSGRLKQIFVLIIVILIGMIISIATAEAKDTNRAAHKKGKAIFRKQTNRMVNACEILSHKRNTAQNTVVKDRSKLKYR